MKITVKSKEIRINNDHMVIESENRAELIQFLIKDPSMIEGLNDMRFYLQFRNRLGEVGMDPLTATLEGDQLILGWLPSASFSKERGKTEIQIVGYTQSLVETEDETYQAGKLYFSDDEGTFLPVYPEDSEHSPKVGDAISGTVYEFVVTDEDHRWSTMKAVLYLPEDIYDEGTPVYTQEQVQNLITQLNEQVLLGKTYASDAQEWAKGSRSDGNAVTHSTDNAKYYKNLAKDWASKTNGPVEGSNMSAKYYAGTADSRAKEAEGYALGTVSGTPSATFAGKNAKELASDAQDWAKGTRSDGKTPSHTSDSAKAYAESAAESADIVSAHAPAIEAIADDLENIDAVAADIRDEDSAINAVAENLTNINSVAANEVSIDAVAGNASNINTVAGAVSNVGTVASNINSVNAVAGNATNINAVNSNKTNIDTVAGKTSDISIVAGISSDVTNVASIKGDIPAVVGIKSDVSAVAAIDEDVTTVAGIDDEITALADSDVLSDINIIATDITDEDSVIKLVGENIVKVGKVADIDSDVTTVAGVYDKVTTVAGVASNVTTVAGISSDVTNVASIKGDVSAVAGIKTDVSEVAAIDEDVTTVATIASDVSKVADIDDDVSAVATNATDISTVADDITKVSAVADDLTNIDAVSDDLTNIDNAGLNASLSRQYAEGKKLDGTDVVSGEPGYQDNAKYYAQQVANLGLSVVDGAINITFTE